jgi:hypothetical protein
MELSKQQTVTLAQQTILSIRGMLPALRSGEEIDKIATEVVLSRALLDLAALVDYVNFQEKKASSGE